MTKPSKSAAQQSFDELTKLISVLLKQHGFKKNGKSFYKLESGNTLIINLQRSTSSSRDEIIFTFNLGICSSLLFAYQREGTDRKPAEGYCHVRKRIGFLMPEANDVWWHFTESTIVKELAEQLSTILGGSAIPYLRNHSSDSALIEMWEAGVSPGQTEKARLEYLNDLKRLSSPRQSDNQE